jgi:hypothetical protein
MPPLQVRRVFKWEWAVPLAAVVSLLLSCAIVSARKYYWNDEFFSYNMTTIASFSKMLTAFNDKLNNTPILYFVLGWLWDKAFGSSEISLRLFSSLGFCGALLIIWRTLRNRYDFWSTSIAVVFVINTSYLIYIQNAEARMYGLYLLLCAIILYLYDYYYRRPTVSVISLVMNMLVHAAFVHTHLFGIFYSGAAFVAFIITDRLFNLFRPKLYLSIILGWASLIFYIPAFLIQADAGKPRTWIPAPDLRDLFDIYNISDENFISRATLLVLVLLLVYYFFRSPSKAPYFSRYKVSKPEIPLLVFGVGFLLVPAFVWLLSITVKPVFWPRYMIPTAIGWIILLAFIISRNMPMARLPAGTAQRNMVLLGRANKLLAILFIGICIWQPVIKGRIQKRETYPGWYDLSPSAEAKYGDLPRVLLWGDMLQHLYYSPKGRQYFFILDWKSAVDKYSGTFMPQEYKHMEAWKRNFPDYYRDNIITLDKFTQRYDKFLVIDRPKYWTKCPLVHHGVHDPLYLWEYCLSCPQLMNIRFIHNKAYKVTRIKNNEIWTDSDKWFSLLLVEKVKEPAVPAPAPVTEVAGRRVAPQLAGKATGATM